MTEKKLSAVTGGNRGIGFQICRDLAKEGFEVILTARNTEKGLEAVEKIKDEGLDLKLQKYHRMNILSMLKNSQQKNWLRTMPRRFIRFRRSWSLNMPTSKKASFILVCQISVFG